MSIAELPVNDLQKVGLNSRALIGNANRPQQSESDIFPVP